jgi:choline-glycine betaine transporter
MGSAGSDVLAYSVPAFFVVSMGVVLLQEIAAEPYGLKVGVSQIDTGSRVISLLAPTVARFAAYIALIAVVVGAAVAFGTKDGVKLLRVLGVPMLGPAKGRRGE